MMILFVNEGKTWTLMAETGIMISSRTPDDRRNANFSNFVLEYSTFSLIHQLTKSEEVSTYDRNKTHQKKHLNILKYLSFIYSPSYHFQFTAQF
jgi:hypothetical protein